MASAGAALLVTILAAGVGADDPVSSNVRFNREIVRILQRRCLACHSEGGLSMPLASYRDVRDWGRAIREEIVEQRMPPVTAAPGYGRFQNALGLTQRETTTLLTWLDGGMPRGDERDLPPPFDAGDAGGPDAHPDLRLEIPPQRIPALEELVVRRITIDPTFTSDRLVTRVDVRPGSRAVLRGALVYQEHAWLGGWLPWQHTFASPPARAFLIRKGLPLTVLLYYRGAEELTIDRPAIELHAAVSEAAPLDSFTIHSAAGANEHLLPAATTVWALQPAADKSVQSIELRARRPDGAVDVLLWIPVTRPEWPSMLVLEEPVTLPAKTVLTLHVRSAAPESDLASVAISAWPVTPRPR